VECAAADSFATAARKRDPLWVPTDCNQMRQKTTAAGAISSEDAHGKAALQQVRTAVPAWQASCVALMGLLKHLLEWQSTVLCSSGVGLCRTCRPLWMRPVRRGSAARGWVSDIAPHHMLLLLLLCLLRSTGRVLPVRCLAQLLLCTSRRNGGRSSCTRVSTSSQDMEPVSSSACRPKDASPSTLIPVRLTLQDEMSACQLDRCCQVLHSQAPSSWTHGSAHLQVHTQRSLTTCRDTARTMKLFAS
jgi:hypothetical protein